MRPFYENFMFFSIFLALLAGIVTTLFHSGRHARITSLVTLALCGAMSFVMFGFTAARGESFTYVMGAFPAPWGNELRCSPVESVLAGTFCLVMLLSLLGGERDLAADILPEKQKLYYIMTDLLAASILALCYTNDMFTGYVFIEINTIAACSLVMAKDSGQTIVATIRYLILSLVGSGAFLLGVAMLYAMTGHLLMPSLAAALQPLLDAGSSRYPLAVLSGLMCVGLCVKAAVFPFHTWLPGAHGSATTASSAMLSGVVLKGYLILLVKILCRVFSLNAAAALGAGNVLFILGACSMIFASIRAVQETHAKRMIAYSSVAQIGYICLGIGLSTRAGIAAALFQILAHAFTKPLLFISVGGLIGASGHRKKLYYFRGAGRRCPVAGLGFTVGALSMVGIPLFAGFITKLTLTQACLEAAVPQWQMILGLLAIAASSLLNAWYYLPAVLQIWKGTPPIVEDGGEPLHAGYQPGGSFRTAVYVMSAAAIGLGCFAWPLCSLLQRAVGLL